MSKSKSIVLILTLITLLIVGKRAVDFAVGRIAPVEEGKCYDLTVAELGTYEVYVVRNNASRGESQIVINVNGKAVPSYISYSEIRDYNPKQRECSK